MENATIRGYFNSAQALADYAEILIYLKNKLLAHDSPIIVVGASYGGRKYIHAFARVLCATHTQTFFN